MLAGTSGVGIQAGLQHPYSRGTIMIRSKSAFDKPLINPNYYGIEKDIEILQFGIEFARKLARTSPMSDREWRLLSFFRPSTELICISFGYSHDHRVYPWPDRH